MARKPTLTQQRIAEEFRRYLAENPGLTRRQRVAAFNRIADTHLKKKTPA